MTVKEAIASHCVTDPLAGLSKQIISETLALAPGILVPISIPGIVARGNAHLLIQRAAYPSLIRVRQARPNATMVVNSAFRPLPEQIAVWLWHKEGRCDITLAAPPGLTAPHTLGIALDIQDEPAWRAAFAANSWRWQGEHDKMHQQFAGPHRTDVAEISIKAFQTLYNRHTGEHLIVDGRYGPATESAVLASPAAGWHV